MNLAWKKRIKAYSKPFLKQFIWSFSGMDGNLLPNYLWNCVCVLSLYQISVLINTSNLLQRCVTRLTLNRFCVCHHRVRDISSIQMTIPCKFDCDIPWGLRTIMESWGIVHLCNHCLQALFVFTYLEESRSTADGKDDLMNDVLIKRWIWYYFLI